MAHRGNTFNRKPSSDTSVTTTTRLKAPKAKCAENQVHVDKLHEKLQQQKTSNYKYSLQKALKSLTKHKQPISTYKEALTIDGIGPHIANYLIPEHQNVKKRPRHLPSPSASCASNGTVTKTQRIQTQNKNILSNATTTATTTAAAIGIPEGPSAKERRYRSAVQHAEQNTWRNQGLQWRVKLLIDMREGKAGTHFISKCRMSGIPCEEEILPIGDMAWLAEGLDPLHMQCVKAKLLLGTIVERKTTPDLRSSLFGTRYNEQSLRLKNSGLPQVLFLIEGDLNEDLTRCPADTLHSAAWCLRLFKGFSIVQTKHVDDTVLQLKRMHRRILQRTFPSAFFDEALPSFAEPDSYRRRSSGSGRRSRRRPESLMELTFDTDPALMPGYRRFITFEELVAKIELDREQGTRTVGHIHAAMLKQVPSLSDKKCQAITRVYPTVNRLMSSFADQEDNSVPRSFLSDVEIQDMQSTQVRKLGDKSAAEMYLAYWMDDEQDKSDDRRESLGSQGSNKYIELLNEYHANQTVPPLSQLTVESHPTMSPSDGDVGSIPGRSYLASIPESTKPSPKYGRWNPAVMDASLSSSSSSNKDASFTAVEEERKPSAQLSPCLSKPCFDFSPESSPESTRVGPQTAPIDLMSDDDTSRLQMAIRASLLRTTHAKSGQDAIELMDSSDDEDLPLMVRLKKQSEVNTQQVIELDL